MMGYESHLPFDVGAIKDWMYEHYGLSVQDTSVRVGYMSTVVFADTNAGRFVIKCVKNQSGVTKAILSQIKRVQVFAKNSLPVAQCVGAADHTYVHEVNGMVLSVWEYLQGHSFVPGNDAQLMAAGEMLGKIHRVASGLCSDEGVALMGWREMGCQIESDLQALMNVSGDGAKLGAILRAALQACAFPAETERVLIHNDFRAQNLLFVGNAVSGVLDWDDVCLAPRVFDVAYALIFFQAVLAKAPLSDTQMVVFLQGYHQVNALSADEWAVLPAWLGCALVKGLTLWGHICYVDGVNMDAKIWIDAYLPLLKQTEAIKEKMQGVLGG